VVDLRILKSRQFAVGVTFAAALGVCLYGPIFLLPVYFERLFLLFGLTFLAALPLLLLMKRGRASGGGGLTH
jgi:hypothetical protein